MELNPMHWMLLVLQPHDFKGFPFVRHPCCDFKAVRKAFTGNNQAVVSGCRKRVWQSRKYPLIGMCDFRGLSVHQSFCADNLRPVDGGQ